MLLLDNIQKPSGRVEKTAQPVWRVRDREGMIRWAFVEEKEGKIQILGYPEQGSIVHTTHSTGVAGAVVGMSAGALLGTALGGIGVAVAIAAIGLVLGAIGDARSSRKAGTSGSRQRFHVGRTNRGHRAAQ